MFGPSQMELARIQSVSAPNAQGFLSRPSSLSSHPNMSGRQFLTSIKYGLGVDLRRGAAVCPKPHKDGQHHLDALGSHAVTCKPDGDPVAGHNDVRDWLVGVAHLADVTVVKEPRGLLPDDRRPDFILRGVEGRDIAVDTTIANTLQISTISRASVQRGAAAQFKEDLKKRKYTADLALRNIDFVPFAVETYGCLGSGARNLLNILGNRIARKSGVLLSVVMKDLYFDLSTIVRRRVAMALLARQPAGLVGQQPGEVP